MDQRKNTALKFSILNVFHISYFVNESIFDDLHVLGIIPHFNIDNGSLSWNIYQTRLIIGGHYNSVPPATTGSNTITF